MSSAHRMARAPAGRSSTAMYRNTSFLSDEPDPLVDPQAWDDYWNAHWKRIDTALSASRVNPASFHARSLGAARSTAILSDSSLFELVEWRSYLSRDIYAFYQDGMKDGALMLVSEVWDQLSVKQREICALQNLIMADIRWATQAGRTYCPEMNVKYLVHDSGFLALLDTIIESGARFQGKDYIEIINPLYDRMVGINRTNSSIKPVRAQQFELASVMNERNRYIYHVILAMSESIADQFEKKHRFNHDQPRYYVKKPSLPGWPTTWRPEDPHVGGRGGNYGGLRAGAIDKISKEMLAAEEEERKAKHAELCHGCCRRVAQAPELVGTSKGFMYCGKCLKLDPVRKVPYCSTECQTVHYKAMHKKFCGKHYADVLPTPIFLPAASPSPPFTARWQLEQMTNSFPTLYHFRYTPPGSRVNTIRTVPMKLRREAGLSDEAYRKRWELLRDKLKVAVESYKPNARADDLLALGFFAVALPNQGEKEGGVDDELILHQIVKDFRVDRHELVGAVMMATMAFDFGTMEPKVRRG